MTAIDSLVAGLVHIKYLLRFRPFDVSTEAGRSNERHRRAMLTALAAALARSLSIATALVTVPLTLHYLGTERYGMWITMSSLVAMLSFADLGIGNGILNAVSKAHGNDDYVAVKEYVTSGLFVLSAIALCVITTFGVFYLVVPWDEIFNVTSEQAKQDAGPAMAVLILCFALAMPLGVVQRIQMGLQKGFMANLWQCFSSLLALCGVILAIRLEAGLPWLVLAFAGSPLLASLLNSISYFGWLQRELAPSPSFISRNAMKHVAHIGVLFLVLQVVGAVTYSSDNIIIAQYQGADAVAAYAVPQRLFSMIPIILSMAIAPLWPAYGEAIARGDYHWVRVTMLRSFFVSVGFAAAVSFTLVFFGSAIIKMWVGNLIVPSFSLLLGLGIWQIIQAGGNAAAMLLNGANVVRFQVVVATITGVVALTLKLILVQSIGVPGAIWSTIIAYSVCAAVPIYWRISLLTAPQSQE